MPFFEPMPPMPPEPASPQREWAPPSWDRPSEGTLGAIVSVGAILGRSDEAVFALDHVRAFPNGFTLNLAILRDPRSNQHEPPMFFGQPQRWPRLGVEFSDGRRAGHEAPGHFPGRLDARGELEKDEQGIPTSAVLLFTGGGGGGMGGFHFNVWVFPLPPPGELKVHAAWPSVEISETTVVLSADEIRDAAARAHILWS